MAGSRAGDGAAGDGDIGTGSADVHDVQTGQSGGLDRDDRIGSGTCCLDGVVGGGGGHIVNGHGGGDYWVVKHFVDAILEGKPCFFDVYRSTAIAAVSILGWRSVLNKSKRYDIPDFRKERDKKKWENDNLTPFPAAGAPNTLPFNSRDKI